MSKNAIELVRARHVPPWVRLMLAGVCCAVFLAFLITIAQVASRDPLMPLRDVRFSLIAVCSNFAVCLGSVAVFGYWLRNRRAAADREAQR